MIRKQILMSEWLDGHIEDLGKNCDLSFSEIIRLSTSYVLAQMALESNPKCKLKIDTKILSRIMRECENKFNQEERKKLIAEFYYEAKKILESTSR